MLKAVVGEQVLFGVVASQGLWKNSGSHEQLVNALTPDCLSDMGGGETFFFGREVLSGCSKSEG